MILKWGRGSERLEAQTQQKLTQVHPRECTPERKFVLARFFKKTSTNYILNERLLNVEFDKIIFCFVDYFPKVAEAANRPKTYRLKYRRINQMRSFMQNNCAVSITKHQSLKLCKHFLLFHFIDLSSSTTPRNSRNQHVALEGATKKKNIQNKRIRRHP